MEPLLLLPGFMSDARVFGAQIEALSAHMPLMVGQYGRADSIRDMAELVLEQAPARFALAGQGMGGMVAIELARRAPERVSRLALLGVDPLGEPPAKAAERDVEAAKARAGRLGAVLRHQVASDGVALCDEAREALLSFMAAMGEGMGTEAYLRQTRALQRRPDQQGVLRRMALPTLVLAGVEDLVAPPRRQELMTSLMAQASPMLVEGAGHLALLEQPARVTRALGDWLGWG